MATCRGIVRTDVVLQLGPTEECDCIRDSLEVLGLLVELVAPEALNLA